ncbi:hypothetical protein H0H92_001061 [Tricholoma furcatifolium]|nr:hypothetical protein H0H92_001061 [Tricholoma furcatifolium]
MDVDQAFDEVAEAAGFEATHIKLEAVPRALKLLDLPPDDEEVLAVFRNAASGWSAPLSSAVQNTAGAGDWVSREDWRSVCAVLLGTEKDDDKKEEDNSGDDDDAQSDGDQYLEDDGDVSEDDEEYVDEPSTSHRRTRARTRGSANYKDSSSSPSPSPSSPRKLTKRQKETALEAFSLFFADIPTEDIPNQRIMIKDIQRVAKLLGEKIKADEMVDMLEAFSTSPDKSVSLDDFGRIMVSAKLI